VPACARPALAGGLVLTRSGWHRAADPQPGQGRVLLSRRSLRLCGDRSALPRSRAATSFTWTSHTGLAATLAPATMSARGPGYSNDMARRIETHRKGQGSPLLAAALAAGIDWHLVQIWPDADRSFERKLHHRHGSWLCPEPACVPAQRERRLQLRLPLAGGWGAAGLPDGTESLRVQS